MILLELVPSMEGSPTTRGNTDGRGESHGSLDVSLNLASYGVLLFMF